MQAPGMLARQSDALIRFLLLTVVSLVLIYADYPNGEYRKKANDILSVISYPLVAIASLPAAAAEWVSDLFESEEDMHLQLQQLEAKQLILQSRLQKLEAIEAENEQLRNMLGAAQQVSDKAMVARLVAVNPEPFTRKIVIDKGRKDGAFFGQPVISASGIIGQITEANLFDSRVTLITDASHAIPVQVLRNGLRTILQGTGASNELSASFLTRSADIQKGDVLISSGLGGRFPPNYPVARVADIVSDPNEAFLKITTVPMAKLDHGRQVLIIWPGKFELKPEAPQ